MRILERPRISLKWVTPDSEKQIESAGRVCWESWGKSDNSLDGPNGAREFIRRLRKVGHIDVMEEAELSIWIECSRACSHQIVRHRTAHFLQASQRYIRASEPEVMVPPSVRKNEINFQVFQNAVEQAYNHYGYLSGVGIRPEDSRFLLPNATLTKLKAKANFANWRRFIELRSHQSAQWEIRMISDAILMMANDIAPSVFEDQYDKFIELGKDGPVADIVLLSEFGVPCD